MVSIWKTVSQSVPCFSYHLFFPLILCALVLDLLELEFQAVVNCHVGLGIEPGSSERTASDLKG